MRIIDSHAHLNHGDLLPQVQEVLRRARDAEVDGVVVVGYDLQSSEAAVELAHTHPNLVAAVGLHPYEAASYTEGDLQRIAELARDPAVHAIGEIGLDFHGDDAAPAKDQERLARAQFEIARARRLPAVLHQRDSGLRIEPLLDAFSDIQVVFHCFAGDRALLRTGLEHGAYISFAGPLTYRRNADLRELAGEVPLERLLVETDSPYLAPQGHRGRTNEPAYVLETVAMLAQLRGMSLEAMATHTAQNARKAFRLD